RVLFQATSAGASIESRGRLTGLTPLLDSIRDKNDEQDGRLTSHDRTLASHGTRLGKAESRLDGHDSTLAAHNTRITKAQSRGFGVLAGRGCLVYCGEGPVPRGFGV